MFPFKKYDFKNYKISLLLTVLLLSGIGAYLIKLVETENERLFMKQIMGIGLGLFIIAVVSLIDYHFIAKFYIVLYIINLGLLFAVRLFGVDRNGAKRWIMIDKIGIQFQPSELSKIILIIVMAKIFTMFKAKMDKFYVLIITGIIMGIPTFLVLIQTDLSSSMVLMFTFAMMVLGAGLSYKIILPILLLGIPAIMGLFWYIQQPFQFLLTGNQQTRVMAMLYPEEYGATVYQQNNSIQVIGSGRLTGKLVTEGISGIRSDTFVPVSESDFIFSVLGEAFGFIGSCAVLVLFSLIIIKCLRIAHNAADYMGMLIALGVASMFMFQTFVNIGVATAILPNTGLPLPFLSYGLSSLVSSMIAIGLVLNVSLQRKKKRG